MRVAIAILTSAACALSQSFEPVDFNITEALLKNGIDASVLPGPSALAERKSFSGCTAAVSLLYHQQGADVSLTMQCTTLSLIFGSNVIVEGETGYAEFNKAYWSQQQAEVSSHCVFFPEKALDVSTLVLLSRLTQCPFAAKSGGHSAFTGASNIEDGITVSFMKMKKIKLSADKKSAHVQPGNVWHDVYSTLEKDNLAVVGGRVRCIVSAW
jgi:hypothetical protein